MNWWLVGVAVSVLGWSLAPPSHPAIRGLFIVGWVTSTVMYLRRREW